MNESVFILPIVGVLQRKQECSSPSIPAGQLGGHSSRRPENPAAEGTAGAVPALKDELLD